ncbi:hypothetical protein [Sporolactobacillus terrae]|uniref:Uncharacterized protein n=1 Tax=Sporolactobacillus terrae TaxID=269673 RepID=A0A410D4Z6_9BACL|nr:hypothetical protein [Sporolactobacillus terrae]QAA21176.1 hypothetical protein C0674_00090 [Sporolactobacillus terrae]QAA24150.1 hypothetical protein C0679_00090 [Sporolactobacillus terrae]UAK15959.1 hypothetical protein K7399_13285 [Sporolactobacillus terrae]BBN97313.1 hypothetical protein St703_00180 [Sporolactobacillus terrae]
MTKRTGVNKHTRNTLMTAAILVLATLSVYSFFIFIQSNQSIEKRQAVASYSFRSNRSVLLHLENSYAIRVDLTATPLNLKVGTKNTLRRIPGNISRYSSSIGHSGYMLTLTPDAYQAFKEDFVNTYGSISVLQPNKKHHAELVYVSI